MIAINELSSSYMTEMEANEVDSIFGGFIGDFPESGVGSPNPATGIVFTPTGGNAANLFEAYNLAVDYSGRNGFVFEVVHGGSFGFYSLQAVFQSVPAITAAAAG